MDCRSSQTDEPKGEAMRENLLLVLLLASALATSAAQVAKKPQTEHAAPVAKTQKKAAVSKQKEGAQAKTTEAQEGTAEAQPGVKNAQGKAEGAQAKSESGQTEEAQSQTAKDPKLTSVPGANALGMSILGNQETPTALVIVPWKSSEVGRATGISPMLDDSRQPVEKKP
jgi:cobalamin biosynthesis Mg chelatase CobN